MCIVGGIGRAAMGAEEREAIRVKRVVNDW